MNAAEYTANEYLRDGRALHIRALRPTDREGLLGVFERSSDETRYHRFFAPKKGFTPQEVESFLHIDFVHCVALVALLQENEGQQVLAAGARYVIAEPGRAELAFTVGDPHQNLGIGTLLMRHLVLIADAAGLRELSAEVLPDNTPMLKVFAHCGLDARIHHHAGVAQISLDLSRSRNTVINRDCNVGGTGTTP